MNFGVKWLAPSKGRFGYVDVALTLVEFFDDLLHSNAVTSTKEIPVCEFGGGVCTRGEDSRD
jgi:hypothetical protein